jgi:hypothetical protein
MFNQKNKNPKQERKFFTPYIEKVKNGVNHVKKNSKYGSIIKNVYIYGSYARNADTCQDLDILVTISKRELQKFTNLEENNFTWNNNQSKFFNYRQCSEYPECINSDDVWNKRGNYKKDLIPICKQCGECYDIFYKQTMLKCEIESNISIHIFNLIKRKVGNELFEKEIIHLVNHKGTKDAYKETWNLDSKLWKTIRII